MPHRDCRVDVDGNGPVRECDEEDGYLVELTYRVGLDQGARLCNRVIQLAEEPHVGGVVRLEHARSVDLAVGETEHLHRFGADVDMPAVTESR